MNVNKSSSVGGLKYREQISASVFQFRVEQKHQANQAAFLHVVQYFASLAVMYTIYSDVFGTGPHFARPEPSGRSETLQEHDNEHVIACLWAQPELGDCDSRGSAQSLNV